MSELPGALAHRIEEVERELAQARLAIESLTRQLHLSEERYRTLFASIDDAYCLIELVVDAQGKTIDYLFLEANAAFEQQTGLEAPVGKTIRELAPDISPTWFDIYGQIVATGETRRFENHDPALQRWFDAYASRVGGSEKRQVTILFKDITARRLAEQDRAELLAREQLARAEADASRQRQHDLFMQTPVAIAILDGPEHLYTFANAPYRAMVNGRDVVGKTLHEALPDVRDQGFDRLLDQVMATGEPFVASEMPVRLEHHVGDERLYLNFTYTPKRDAAGVIDGVLASLVDVTDQVLARREAEEASRLKDEFIATVSHELRTPLTSILGWAHLLHAGSLSEEQRPRALETIERNARVQAQLVEDLLDMSRILAGKLTLETEPLDMGTVVEAALESIRPAASAKGIWLQPVLDPRGVVLGDPNRLQQIVWNLLTNAVKFTPHGGRVQVTVQRLDSSVELAVVDTGQGIAREFLPHVFERFRQAEGSISRAKGGLGLGLSIVRQLVELHGGTITASSEGEGEGASFTVRLPLSATHQGDAGDAPVARPRAPSRTTSPGQLAGVRVLVVDDEQDVREMLTVLLEDSGATVRQAASADEGRLRFATERPDVLVSDIGMPGEDGYAFLASLRRLPPEEGGKVLAVALTAYARSEDRTRALKAGFSNHVAKPVEPAELIAVIASLARRTRATLT